MNKYQEQSKAREAWTCTRKRRFDTEVEARASIDPNGPIELDVYACPFCSGWHRTHATMKSKGASQNV